VPGASPDFATLGALFMGEVMGMTPVCCWYQQFSYFPWLSFLGMAAFAEDRRGARSMRCLAETTVAKTIPNALVAGLGSSQVPDLRKRASLSRANAEILAHPDPVAGEGWPSSSFLSAHCLLAKIRS
jgi:hypothetical protein